MSGIIDPIANVLASVLVALHSVTGSYLASIVVLTIIVKALLHPLTRRQLRSMKDMQALAPQIEVLRRKHKENPQLLNQEMMKLYRTSKVNPFGGCLPLLAQLPVLYALFALFRRQDVFGGEMFFGVSLENVLTWGLMMQHPLLTSIPILTGLTTYYQQRMSITDPAQAQMFIIMPFFIAYTTFAGWFPIGLSIYWIVSTAVYIVEYYIVVGIPKRPGVAPPRSQKPKRAESREPS